MTLLDTKLERTGEIVKTGASKQGACQTRMNAPSASWPWDLTPFYARNVLIRKHRLQLKASLSPDFFLKISETPTLEKGGTPLG